MGSSDRLPASVIVATRNNAALLADALETIIADSSAIRRELIVVDNASTDSTVDVARAVAATAPFDVTIVTERALGHSHARNAGVAAARGELLLFTDDDVFVEDGWADAIAAPFADERVAVVSGRTLPRWPGPPPAWLNGPHRARLALFDFGEEDRLLAEEEAPAGANMAIRAAALDRFDAPFSTALGNQGGRRFAFEETHLIERLRQDGLVAYAAGAVVHHRIRAERMDLGWMRATYFDQGIARLRMQRLRGEDDPTDLARRAVRAGRACVGLWRSSRANDRRERTGAETWDELRYYEWVGAHVERLLGRFPRLVTGVRNILA